MTTLGLSSKRASTSTSDAVVVNIIGVAEPLGATLTAEGVNFSVFSKYATGIDLLLFKDVDDARPSRVLQFDAVVNRTYHYWHVFVPGVTAGQIYGFRVHGPVEPSKGLRFDSGKVLLDPYGRAVVVPTGYNRTAAYKQGDNAGAAMKSVVVDTGAYEWEGDRPLRRPSSQTIIYEMHVRGFTKDSSSGVPENKRGTYAGVIEKIPYLKALGVTAVELSPVFQFDALDCPAGHINYWGYAPVSFFAPHAAYSSRHDPLGPVDEFRDMAKALHAAGIEVILDVVFNHTAEGDDRGPTICFRGFADRAYYVLEDGNAKYANYTGCGNTLNANHPITRRLIVDSLRYWVREMHVDGFRFDLASILSRDIDGRPLPNPPILWDIESDPALAGTKFIAEAWDAAGLYQVGSFVGDAWKEWNGRFRDDVRSFVRGDDGAVGTLADRMLGSPAVYGHKQREMEASVNFVTCHDGFTLNDLVSYNDKHNEANGESNRDGANDNRSWNCGVEGPTDDLAIERVRNRQVKNFLTLTMLSLGVPMLLMGDEVRRTQRGNNNAYCQDDETSWFDWKLLEKHADVHRFTQQLLARRVRRSAVTEQRRVTLTDLLRQATFTWHGTTLGQPDWASYSHALALGGDVRAAGLRLHLIMNAYWEPLDFALPPAESDRAWRRWIDTSLDSPNDITEWDNSHLIHNGSYQAGPRSVVVLWAPLNPA
jgi:glycogen operon protein